MSGEEPQALEGGEAAEPVEVKRSSVAFGYAGASQVVTEGGGATLALFGNVHRAEVRGGGKVDHPLLFREALSALHAVVKSDFRYVPKDKTAYLAYRRMKAQTASLNLWEAQRAYVDWLARNDPLAFMVLDPIVSVHPDELFFEVFSKDEGSYAKLGLGWPMLGGASKERVHGTTNIDFSDALFDGIQRMRSYRETRLAVGKRGGDARHGGRAGGAGEEGHGPRRVAPRLPPGPVGRHPPAHRRAHRARRPVQRPPPPPPPRGSEEGWPRYAHRAGPRRSPHASCWSPGRR